jgi:hypothetical protein
MERKYIGFRLREGHDIDLMIALEGVGTKELSDLCRNGLRQILRLNTEEKISAPAIEQPQPITIKSKPAIFVPQHKRKEGGQC